MKLFRSLLLVLAAAFATAVLAGNVDDERAKVREQSRAVLETLYKARPEAREVIANAAGYATFRNIGVKLGVAGTGRGRGLAQSATGEATFMRFVEVQAGLGAGVKRYDLVFVFETPEAYRRFVSKEWQYSGQSTVAARSKRGGKAIDDASPIGEGVWLYQLTSTGLAAEATLKASKYFPDKELN